MQKVSLGRIVHYTLTAQDAEEINRRRTDSYKIRALIEQDKWSMGAQAHIGNGAQAGQIYPAMVIRVWGETGCSNLQVFLDGNDQYWATSRNPSPPVLDAEGCSFPDAPTGDQSVPGFWHWPPRG